MKLLEEYLMETKMNMITLKKEIEADDKRFEKDINESKVQDLIKNGAGNDLVMFHQ